MSSTPFIEIDWSSASQHSYPQLGDFILPENDSAIILHNTERSTVLSAKDILSLDIDDIYPYMYSTLHFKDNDLEETYNENEDDYFQELLNTALNAEIQEVSHGGNDIPPVYDTPLTPIQDNIPLPLLDTTPPSDNLPTILTPIQDNIPLPPLDTAPTSENLRTNEKKNTLLVSLKKFHVTMPKRSGYNKIYEIRRSRSFFFELADHNQNTNEIHLKIHTNDYHMKTKPISYNNTKTSLSLWHLYTLTLINNPEHFHKDTQCGIPTPFVMSHHRHACVIHQRTFSQNHCFKNIKKKPLPKSDDIPTDFINTKSSYANLLYYRWLNGKSKRITSRRLGISYNSDIHARDLSTTFKKGNRHMYRKCLTKFQRDLSPNLRTQKQQDIRFKRTCRRVFNKMRLPPDRKATNQDYLAIARKYRFVFMKNQKVKIPIRHLSYKQCDSIPNADDYSFLVPYFATDFNHKQQIMTKLTQASSSTGPSAPPENYNPIPDVFIPKKYHDIIPKDPIYMNNRYVVPGSREWFTYMYNVDESYYPPESSTPRYNAKGKYVARTPVYRSGVVENYIPSHIVEKSQLRRTEKIKADALTIEAAYHGTTPKHYNTHANIIKSITDASYYFHESTPGYLAKRKQIHDSGLSIDMLDKKHNKAIKNHNLHTQGAVRFPTHPYVDVSDDTAEVEYQPNKRDDINNENHYFSFQDHKMK
ncbi:hypothetical protein RirG_067450 [Rhizophagus irregularis DAOM 197198w]|uniref:DUF8211 domain-containing protein n=1 Tax=Rhizophagus irregularis (strain DAOM 197198w) TaxID=1432141 RepID=A0A015N0T3_RHIIW|nr:hypothetical protein RirG_067450 [Rhizophagus irregularis DAOM 197198w]